MNNLFKFIGGIVATVGVFVALPYMAVDIYDKASRKKNNLPTDVEKKDGENNDDAE
jgi:hypothetical protein